MKTYSVRVSREGKWWIVSVPDIDGLTQARRLAEVEDMARSLISMTLDVAPSSFALDITLEAIEDAQLTEIMDAQRSTRAELEAAQARYSERLRADARKLAANGVAGRDIGYILGVSFQRVSQLLDA